MPLSDYQPLAQLLAYQIEPAECHGLLCGMLCADPSLTTEGWLAAASRETIPSPDTLSELRRLFTLTLDQLDSNDCDLALLLPSDEHSLHERTRALSAWCQGFLAGLGLGGLHSLDEFEGEIHEFLNDVSEIARIDFGDSQHDEGDEHAYSEIVEYLRVGVLLFHQSQRQPLRSSRRLH